MAGKLKVELLTSRSGKDGSFGPGEKIDLPVREGITRIARGEAKPVKKAEYEAALRHFEGIEAESAEKQARIDAIARQEELTSRLEAIYREEAEVAAALAGIVPTEYEIADFVKTRMEGEPIFKAEDNA